MIGWIKRWLSRRWPFYMPKKWVDDTYDYDMRAKGIDPEQHKNDFLNKLNDKLNGNN